MKYYVYALDTENGQITAALSCRDEKTAKQAYQIAKRSFETEYGETSSFHFGFTGVDSSVCIEYSKRGWQKTESFDVDDFEFAETQTEKCFSKEKKWHESRYVQKDLDFLRYVKNAISKLFLGFDVHEVPAEPKPEKPPPWKRIRTVTEGTPTSQSDVIDCSQQAASEQGIPHVIVAESMKAPTEGAVKLPPIILAARKKETKKESASTDDTGRTTFTDWLKEPHEPTPEEVIVKNHDEISNPLIVVLKEQTEILKERLPLPSAKETESANGSHSPKQRPPRALSELMATDAFIKKIMPLPKHDNSNSKWITSQRAAKELGITEARLSNQRIKNESVNYKEEDYAGFIIGRSDNGLIWCKSGGTSKAIFYLFSEVTKRRKKQI